MGDSKWTLVAGLSFNASKSNLYIVLKVLSGKKITKIIDLRMEGERDKGPLVVEGEAGINVITAPIKSFRDKSYSTQDQEKYV